MSNIEELLKLVPSLIELFLPGYIFIYINRYFSNKKDENYDSTVVSSLIISYCINLVSSIIWIFFTSNTAYKSFFSIVLAIVSAFIILYVKRKKWWKDFIIKLTRISPVPNIWKDIIDLDVGSHIRFSMVYHEIDVCVEGNVFNYDVFESGCHFAITKYKIYDLENKLIVDSEKKEGSENILYVNSNEMKSIELQKGKKVEKETQKNNEDKDLSNKKIKSNKKSNKKK